MGRVNPLTGAVLAIYWLSPAFAIADFVFGFRVRVAFFDDSVMLRAGYYVLMTLLAVAMTRWPGSIRHLAPLEAGVNVGLTAMGIILTYVGLAADVEAGREVRIDWPLVPVLISVGIMILSNVSRHLSWPARS
jgi:hypothetical protein